MAKFDTDEIGKPGKPPKQRRFPWRLWLYAIVMTAGAGAGGYYVWQYRSEASDATSRSKTALTDVANCRADVAKAQTAASDAARKTTDCISSLDGQISKGKELENQLTAMSGNLNASKDELGALRAQRAEAEKRLAAIDEIQRQFARMIDTGQLKVTARRGTLVLSLPSEVLFPSGVADLSKPGELAILEVGITLKRFPDRRFLVVGHTDDVPLKSTAYKDNWDLSTARALTVTRFLIQAGMAPKNLVAAGAGENDPVSKDRARNRRIEIALLPAISDLPPLPASLGDDTAKPDAKEIKVEAPLPGTAPTKPAAPVPAPAVPVPAPAPAAPATKH
jgi:chemotaxis protein MotB